MPPSTQTTRPGVSRVRRTCQTFFWTALTNRSISSRPKTYRFCSYRVSQPDMVLSSPLKSQIRQRTSISWAAGWKNLTGGHLEVGSPSNAVAFTCVPIPSERRILCFNVRKSGVQVTFDQSAAIWTMEAAYGNQWADHGVNTVVAHGSILLS